MEGSFKEDAEEGTARRRMDEEELELLHLVVDRLMAQGEGELV